MTRTQSLRLIKEDDSGFHEDIEGWDTLFDTEKVPRYQDGPIFPYLCAWRHPEFLQMADIGRLWTHPRGTPCMDLRRLPPG